MQALGKLDLIDKSACRQYLLEKTQHRIGGFGKHADNPPDIYHSYLGLAALALMNEPSLLPLEPAPCISKRACEHLKSLSWRKNQERETETLR
jgi:geranylgeranyl transferase type-1 subunit beta